MLVGERADFGPVDHERPEQCRILIQRHPDGGASAILIRQAPPLRVARAIHVVVGDVVDVDDPLPLHQSIESHPGSRRGPGGRSWLVTAPGDRMKPDAIKCHQLTEPGVAQRQCLFQHRIEHRGETAVRGVNDAQHLGSCGLLRQRLVALSGALVPLPLRLDKLVPQIGYELLRIVQRAVRRRAHLRTSSGRPPAHHTVSGPTPGTPLAVMQLVAVEDNPGVRRGR